MTAGFMLLGVLCLALVVDTGRLYMEKRSLQRLADVVALSVASQKACKDLEAGDSVTAEATAALNVATKNASNGVVVQSATCGGMRGNPREFETTSGTSDVVQVVLTHPVTRSLVAGGLFSSVPVDLRAVAAAGAGGNPLARLSIRSTLASVNTEKSALLNSVVGGMLGGNINLPVAAWSGLLNTDINLLTFMDALAVRTGIGVGNYDQVLEAPISVGNLLGAAVDALPQGADPDVSVGLNNIINLAVGLPTITLGELITIDSNTPSSALNVPLNVLQLVQGGVQLANGDSAVAVNLPTVGIPGVASASVKVKVIEPAQISAIGDPSEIDLVGTPLHEQPNIFVRTAQVRTLVTVNLSGVTGLVSSLTSALSPLLGPIIDFIETTSVNPIGGLLNGVGSLLSGLLNLVSGLLTGLLGTSYQTDWQNGNVIYADALGQPLSISLDAASASGWVTDFSCTAGNKSLETQANTSVAYLRIGKMQENEVFSVAVPAVEAVPLVDIGYRKYRARRACSRASIFSSWTCSNQEQWQQNDLSYQATPKDGGNVKRYTIAGLGLKVDGPIGGSSSPKLTYSALTDTEPPDLVGDDGQPNPPAYKDVPSFAVLSGLGATLSNSLKPYQSTIPGALGALLGGTLSLLSGVVSAVMNLLEDVIDGLLDPILNSLLSTLGADLAVTDLGANLTCNSDEGVKLLN